MSGNRKVSALVDFALAAVNSVESKADWKGLAYVPAGENQPDEGNTSNASEGDG